MKRLCVTGTLAVLVLTGCSSGPDLTDDQKSLATKVAENVPLEQKDAECIIGKVKDDSEAYSAVKSDTNFSELNGISGGSKVAKAYTDCTGKDFGATFGYRP